MTGEKTHCHGKIMDRVGRTEVIEDLPEGGAEMFLSLELGKKGSISEHETTILELKFWKVGIYI